MSASPILPAPRIAITRPTLIPPWRWVTGSTTIPPRYGPPWRPEAGPGRSGPGDQGAGEEGKVSGALGEPPDQVSVPVAAVRHIHPHPGSLGGEPPLLG